MLDRRSRACCGAMAGIYHRLLGRFMARPWLVLRDRVSLPGWEKAVVAARSLAGASAVTSSRVVVVGGGLAGLAAATGWSRAAPR